MTVQWNCQSDCSEEALKEAAALLRSGKLVAFPTETVYGLGADARNTEAVASIYTAKGRPSDNPLIVHITDRSQLAELTTPPAAAVSRLLDAYWPGPLTVVLPVLPDRVSPLVTAGLTTVAVRVPDHPVALRLLAAAGCPIAAPSANRSGRPSPTRAEHVQADLDGLIDGIVDGGPTGLGVESTVVQYMAADGHRSYDELHILRPGGISLEELQAVLGDVKVVDAATSEKGGDKKAPRAPGMKYTHYAPQGNLLVVRTGLKATRSQVQARMQDELDAARSRGEQTAVLAYQEEVNSWRADYVVQWGSRNDPHTVAQQLYAALRSCDECGATFIVAEACEEVGIGAAIMNRLRKAAGGQIVEV